MNTKHRYRNPQWLAKPAEESWTDFERRRWMQFYNESISPVLVKLGLKEDNKALFLAKNLWYSANADEQTIKNQLEKYKADKVLKEDVQRAVFA